MLPVPSLVTSSSARSWPTDQDDEGWMWEERFFPGHWPDWNRWERLDIFPKIFWKPREEQPGRWAAGLRRVLTLEEMAPTLRIFPEGTRLFGGQAFHRPAQPGADPVTWTSTAWASWPTSFYFVPEWEICPGATGTLLRWLHNPSRHGASEAALAQMARRLLRPRPLTDARRPRVGRRRSLAIGRRDFPDYQGWAGLVQSLLRELPQGPLQKVVLARASRLELSSDPEPFQCLRELAALHPECAHFCLQLSAESGAFLGATPERLFRRRGRLLETEAVAGTRARSLAPEEDARLEKQLRESPKEQHEHALVAQAITTVLHQVCEPGWQMSAPHVLKLTGLQHLRSVFSGMLRPEITDADLLARLHPTPATGGFPPAVAQAWLRQEECFDRGWFAAPLGCFERDRAEVVVAIRSLRVWAGTAEIYAGAGIVPGSEPEQEWAELDKKAAAALALFSA